MTEPVYVVALVDVKDQADYIDRYGLPVLEQLQASGAEVLAATGEAKELEGDKHGNWTVIIRFADAATAQSWYESEAYAPLKRLRAGELSRSGDVFMVPGFDPNLLG
jgi:uncharacterized protein (DUF1330 family)